MGEQIGDWEWRTCGLGRYSYKESITVLESRVVIRAAERTRRDASQHGMKRLYLVDNFGAACSVS